MDPRTRFDDSETVTARAFVELFKRRDGDFKFGVDSQVDDDDEVRAFLLSSCNDYDGRSVIGITGINNNEIVSDMGETLQEMGVEILDERVSHETADEIGEYTATVIDAAADPDESYEWDVPHLVVYGWLSPEIEECVYAAFGHQYEMQTIRNHFIVWGEGLDESDQTALSDAVQRSSEFGPCDRDHVVSDIRTATIV